MSENWRSLDPGLRNRGHDADGSGLEEEELRSDEEDEEWSDRSGDRSGDRTDGGGDEMEEQDNRAASRAPRGARAWELRHTPWPAEAFKQVKAGNNPLASWVVYPSSVAKILRALAEQWTSGDVGSNRCESRGLCPHAPGPSRPVCASVAAHTALPPTQTRD